MNMNHLQYKDALPTHGKSFKGFRSGTRRTRINVKGVTNQNFIRINFLSLNKLKLIMNEKVK